MSQATSVKQYLDALPEDRRRALEAVRKVIKANLDPEYEEGIQYGMIGYYVPHSVFADGYHCDPKQPLPFASIASQKNHMAVYMFCLYNDPREVARFETEWKKTGKKLDMGKSCVRFKKLEDVALDAIGAAIKRMPAKKFIELYVGNRDAAGSGRKSAKKASKKAAKRTSKKSAKKVAKPAAKKAAKKTAKQAGKQTAKQAAKKTGKKVAKQTTKRAAKQAPKRAAKR